MHFCWKTRVLLAQTLFLQLKPALCARQTAHSEHGGQLERDNGCYGELKLKSDTCRCTEVTIKCINSQFLDTDAFLLAGDHYFHLQEVTIHGNNFVELPKSLFGPSVTHPRLQTLNLSANYIMHVNASALTGIPDLKTLDLSFNEINLHEDDVEFLVTVPLLERLHLRKAFSRPLVGASSGRDRPELRILQKMFATAKLNNLRYLDLSWNFFDYLPYRFVCPLPGLRHLDFSNNNLRSLSLDPKCIGDLASLDIQGNFFKFLDLNFLKTARGLPPYSLLLRQNNFHCNCDSVNYIKWIQEETKVKDRDMLVCERASPLKFQKVPILNVSVSQLDCSVVLDNGGVVSVFTSICFWFFVTVFLCAGHSF